MNFPKQPQSLLRVNLGCGQSPTPGWVNFDSSPSVRLARIPQAPTLLSWASGWLLSKDQLAFVECIRNYAIAYGDGTKGLPLASGSCRVVYASHVLEHFAAPQVHVFLKEVFRILAPGGILRLAVPDLQIYIDAYQSSSDADQLIHSLNFFPPDQQGRVRRWLSLLSGNRTLHQWVYNDVSLGRTLVGSGFVNPVKLEPGETTIPDSGLLNLRERAWESLYMEAVKPDLGTK
jgi:predicted SAM-dependent methyltransferase